MRRVCTILLFVLASLPCFTNAGNGSGIYFGARGSALFWDTGYGTFKGGLIGPAFGFDYVQPWSFYGGGRFYWSFGDINDGNQGRKFENLNMSARFGYTFGKKTTMSLYTGIGYESFKNAKKNRSASCRHFTYVDVYTMLGVLTVIHFSPTLSLGFDFTWAPQIDPWLRIGGFTDIRFDMARKSSYLVEIPFQFNFPSIDIKELQYRLIPFYRYTEIGKGTINTSPTCVPFTSQHIQEGGLRFEFALF